MRARTDEHRARTFDRIGYYEHGQRKSPVADFISMPRSGVGLRRTFGRSDDRVNSRNARRYSPKGGMTRHSAAFAMKVQATVILTTMQFTGSANAEEENCHEERRRRLPESALDVSPC